MPITRTAMIDDDGSRTTGTPFNNAWKTELYNQIDGVVAPLIIPPFRLGAISHSAPPAGLINDWDLASLGNYTAFVLASTGVLDVTGIKAQPNGTLYLLVNGSTSNINLYQFHANSAPGNRFFCPGASNFYLTSWQSAWLLYDTTYPAWIVLAKGV